MAQAADPMMLFIVQPAAVFLALVIVWLVQSLAVLYISRKLIFPQLYKFRITELLIAEVAIAIHEMSHLLSAFLTGSGIDLRSSFLTSKAGRITAVREESVGGWISSIIAAFAPAFVSSSVFFIAVVMLTQVQLPFGGIFSFKDADMDLAAGVVSAAENVILPFVLALLSVVSQPSVVGAVLLYFLIVLSITAGPSEGDWKAAMGILFSPVSLLPLFLLLLIANYVFAQFNIGILVPMVSLLLVSISVVSLGLVAALFLSGLLYLLSRALKRS
ncbi:Uncharacterised protein [uncultured archaeon]|nr:Uncharacterised protein [uncultured archaeon]